ncbi:hypothetical protein SAMN04515674_104242 [Pseudarcicella hirudinis]|uniref:Uncharacterized protein n=2 Tax=Pseudarcicella hirudinis TaxID=1079859 RepID=A0A1I5RTQ4_9BACT|nr:hypothetical protein SAMN04515674_104242 [Pseudarcicella hirudinis]
MCTKVKFLSKSIAIRKIDEYAAILDNRKKPVRSYRCLECGYYHITSMTKRSYKAQERLMSLRRKYKKAKVLEYYDQKFNTIIMSLLTFKDWKRVQERLSNRDKFELYSYCIELFPNVFRVDYRRRDSPTITYETWKKKVAGNKVLSDVEQIAIWEVINLKYKHVVEEVEAEEFIST